MEDACRGREGPYAGSRGPGSGGDALEGPRGVARGGPGGTSRLFFPPGRPLAAPCMGRKSKVLCGSEGLVARVVVGALARSSMCSAMRKLIKMAASSGM